MKYFKFTILLPVILGGLLLNIQIAKAVSCSDAGGACDDICPSGQTDNGGTGCNVGYKCCGVAANSGIIPDGGKMATGDYELNDFVILAINISKWILGISGSVTLLMFVYGGLKMLISEGSSEKVTEAKSIITGAVIGLFIIFASYTIIGFALNTMGIKDTGWASSGWWPKN